MKEKTYRTALGGVLAALALTLLFLGSIFPFAEIAGPAIASACVAVIAEETSGSAGLSVYAAVSLLSLLVVPDKESAMLFVSFFGWFPLLKKYVDPRMRKVPAALLKLLLFNLSIITMYYIALKVLFVPSLTEEFAEYSTAMYIVIMVLSNITILLLDYSLDKVLFLYRHVWRKKLVR